MATTPNESVSRDAMQDAYSHLKQAGNSIRDAARTASADAQTTARTQYAKGRQNAESMAIRAEDKIKERPLAAIGVAFAAGWLISRILR